MKLTDIVIRNLEAPPKGAKVYHDDALTGFGVRVTSTGFKAFVLTHGANRERHTIGRYPIIGLADARTEAKRFLAELTLGKTRPKRASIEGALETYYDTHVATLRPGTQKEIKRLFGRFLPKRGNLEDLTVPALTKILDGISSPSEAEHFHRAAKTFFTWCVERHLLPTSPMANLRAPAKWKARERVLSDDQLRAVWTAADATPGSFGIIVKLLILTGQRRSEIGSLRAEWVDLDKQTCTLPSSITKNKRTHTFPIGKLGMHIISGGLGAAPSGLLFMARGSSTKPFNGWSKAKVQLDKAVDIHWRDINQKAGTVDNGFTTDSKQLDNLIQADWNKEKPYSIAPWTLHDLRRTYATNLQRLSIKLEVIEALLNHVSGTRAGIVGVYQKHRYEAEMREAVEKFEEWFRRDIIRQ